MLAAKQTNASDSAVYVLPIPSMDTLVGPPAASTVATASVTAVAAGVPAPASAA